MVANGPSEIDFRSLETGLDPLVDIHSFKNAYTRLNVDLNI
jgi:hypothetical protein